jgi:dienelactone hydrolase
MSVRVAALVALLGVATPAACAALEPGPPPGSLSIAIPAGEGRALDAVVVGSGERVVILSHGATGTKEDFYEIAQVFADDGWRAIAYDAGDDREADLRAVATYARNTGVTALVLLGGSLGASLSIGMADELDADAVVALSPPASAFGAGEAAVSLDAPLFVAVAEDNEPYATDVRAIAESAGVEPVIVSGDGHGTGMFDDHPDLMDRVVAFASDVTG